MTEGATSCPRSMQQLESLLGCARESEQRLRLALDAVEMGFWEWDPQRGVVVFDDRSAAMLGLAPEANAPLTCSWEERVHPGDWPGVRAKLDELLAGRTSSYEAEYRLRHQCGQWVWVSARGTIAARDRDGRPLCVTGTHVNITPRKRSEAALAELSEKHRRLQANIPGVIYEYALRPDGSHAFPYVNSASRELFGLEPEEVMRDGTCLSRLIHPDDRVRRDETIRRSARTLEPWRQELRHVVGGQVRWYDCMSRPERQADGTVLWDGIMLEITARKQAEEALRESEERLRLALAASNQGFYDLNLQTGEARISPEYATMLGYDPTDGRENIARWAERLHPDDRERVLRTYRACVEGTVPEYSLEYRHRMKSGDWKWIQSSGKVVEYDGAGRPLRMLGTHADISERKRVEETLERTRLLLEAVIEQSPVPTVVASAPDLVVRFANRAASDFLGTTEEQSYIGLTLPEVCRRQTWREMRPDGTPVSLLDLPLARALRGEVTRNEEYGVIRKDGTHRWELVSGTPIYSGAGELVAGVVVFADITERKQAEAERQRLEARLRQAQKMEAVGQLAGGVAHDFNNILTAILGHIDLAMTELQAHLPTAQAALDSLRHIERSAERASTLTRQLLAFSRRQVVRPQRLDLNVTLRDLDAMLRRLVAENIDLRMDLAPQLPAVEADPGQLERVILNLVVNARDAMPDGGQLVLRTAGVHLDDAHAAAHAGAAPGEHVVLTVRDTGHGMDPATVERVFEPFFTTKPPGQGTGLGLPMVYGTVQQAGGHITVCSQPGCGTEFNIFLPAVGGPAAAAEPLHGEPAAPAGTETILFCEDDVAVRELGARMLTAAGYTVLVALDAEHALQMARSHAGPIHLLLTDVIMPGMNGRQLADALATVRANVKTLFVSGYASDVIAHHGVLAAGVDFLEKPFSRGRLLQCVREVLDRPATTHAAP